MARKICILACPSGSRSSDSVKPDTRQQGQHNPEQRRELLDASSEFPDLVSEFARTVRSATSRLTTTGSAVRSHPRAVELGRPRSVAMVTSPVRWTSSRSRWS